MLFLCLLASLAVPGQVDRVCSGDFCHFLAVQDGVVRYIEKDSVRTMRNLVVGNNARIGLESIPTAEAPIRALQSSLGWRVILSAFLDHGTQEASLKIRFFDSSGKLRNTGEVMLGLDEAELGDLFGDGTAILAITTEQEHSYNVSSELWSLDKLAAPKRVLAVRGSIDRFVRGDEGSAPGVWVNRETYDGVDAQTKGRVAEFWAWDKEHASLSLGTK